MSVVPMEWGEPDSRPGLYYDLLWTGLAVVAFAALAYWDPFSMINSITPRQLAGATILGIIFGVAVMYGPFVSERVPRRSPDSRITFAGMFVFVMALQLGLTIAPSWTVLTALATLLTLIPLRIVIYLRTR